jgi:uncharacterized protein (DUF2141 family)
MLKLFGPIGAAMLTLAVSFASPGPAAAALGPDAARCTTGSGQPALLVNIRGFKSRSGEVRVKVYGSNPDEFLVYGKGVRRIDLPVTAGAMEVCVALPRAGTYAVAVRHDADGNGKTGWNDGGGFSNNPSLSVFNLKPNHRKAAISVGNGVKPITIILNYRKGLSIGPIQS